MRQELGYKEKSSQFTKFGQWYADRVQDPQYRDAPWCDMFLAWAANKSGLSDYVGEFAWTPSHAAWFIQQGAWSQKPEPGALVFYDWRGGKSYKGIDHVGVVERVSGKKIHTIEANVDRVWLKRKTRETDKVVGYGLPRVVKANAEKLGDIRSTERPFASPPPAQVGQGSPLDVLGTPPALLAAMVIMTIVLSLRVSGRRRGNHRRLSWAWPLRRLTPPTQPPSGAKVPSPRNPLTPPAADTAKPPREKASARQKTPPGEQTPARQKSAAREKAPAQEKAAASEKPGRPVRSRVPAGSGGSATKHPTTSRRRPYERD
ncbi:CHAP domain-containing protein [Nonomuraea fuscirosea]|uniref:CHAP domain-containing protein n=1 Tax=Nonomuraea fuscirosea TaxID=1291556 RepID=UPI003449A4D4